MLKKERIYLSQDKIKTNNNLTQKYSSKKINNSEKLKNKNSNLNKNNNFSGKRINKTEQNSINNEKKEKKYYFDPIIKNLFNNANKIEKKLSKNKQDYSNARLYSSIDSYKDKNTHKVKCGHLFKGKYLSEYKNQINEKPNST